MDDLATTIAFDGGVYSKFGGYQTLLDGCMKELLGGWVFVHALAQNLSVSFQSIACQH